MAVDDIKKAHAFYTLLSSVLQDITSREIETEELIQYLLKAGITLRDLGHNVINGGELNLTLLHDINRLDPSCSSDNWGKWANEVAKYFDQELPVYRQQVEDITH